MTKKDYSNSPFEGMPVIYSYTRQDAIRDGVLIDVSETAKENGFRIPVALTAESFNEIVVPPEAAVGEDEQGRLWDVLTCARYRAQSAEDQQWFPFKVLATDKHGRRRYFDLKCVLSAEAPNGGPCITIMLPHED